MKNYLLAACWLLALLSAQAQELSLLDTLQRDSRVRTGRLANGLTYYVQTNNEPRDRIELRLVVRAGNPCAPLRLAALGLR